MATLPNMVSNFFKTDGRPRKTIEHTARVIRERGGYIPNGKRGGGAPHMTTAAAANLIIALNGTDTPSDAPMAIDRFRSLVRSGLGWTREEGGLLRSVSECNTFGSALEALIDAAPDVAAVLYQYVKDAYPDVRPASANFLLQDGQAAWLEVAFSRWNARIGVYRRGDGRVETDFEETYILDVNRPLTFYATDDMLVDRRVIVTIGLNTMLQAWVSVYGKEEPEDA